MPFLGSFFNNRLLQFFVLISTLAFSRNIYAQSQEHLYPFRHINTENGLSQAVNHNLFQDSRGFTWIGSFEGLNRFDGKNCVVFKDIEKDSTSLKGNRINGILEDKKGNLWVGTNFAINRYDRKTNHFHPYYFKYEKGKALNDFFIPLCIDENDKLWTFVGGLGGIAIFDCNTHKIDTLFEAKEGEKYAEYCSLHPHAASFAQIKNVLQVINGTWHIYKIANYKVVEKWDTKLPFEVTAKQVTYSENDSLVWLPSKGNLILYNLSQKKVENSYQTDKKDIHFSCINRYENNLWCGTLTAGIFLFDRETKRFARQIKYDYTYPQGISCNRINRILVDKKENIWIAADGKGIDYTNPRKLKFTTYPLKKFETYSPEYHFRTFVADKDQNLWCGTHNHGLLVFDKQKNLLRQFTIKEGLPDNLISFLFKDNQQRIWVGTQKGLCLYHPENASFEHIVIGNNNKASESLRTFYMYQKRNGEIWVMTIFGLYILKEEKGKFRFDSPKEWEGERFKHFLYTFFEDNEGTIYLNQYPTVNKAGSTYFSFSEIPPNVLNSLVVCYHESKDAKYIWMSIVREGLVRFDKQAKTYLKFGEEAGLPSNVVFGILPDDEENLWLSTNKGLCHFNTKTYQAVNYTLGDGLQSQQFEEFAYLKCDDGELIMGGVKGFHAFYPHKIKSYPYPPTIALTALKINDEIAHLDTCIGERSALTLPYAQNTLSFYFTGIDPADAENVLYKYQLAGYDKNYVQTKEGFIRYAHLPAGTYYLKINARNSEGNWNETEKVLKIIILPPFWQTIWFRTLIFLLCVGGIYALFYTYTQRKLRKLQIELAKQKAIEIERTRIAQDMHDDLGSGLSTIRILSESMEYKLPEQNPDLTKISAISNELIDNMREIIWTMNSDNDSLQALVVYIRKYAAEFLETHEKEYHFDIASNLPDLKISGEKRRNTFLTVKEALHNIIKHANATDVWIVIRWEKELRISIKDNGKGFALAEKIGGLGNGLKNIQKRMQAIGGNCVFTSENGTIVEISLYV